MTWTNAFDVGECTVSVEDSSYGGELFRQVIAKGGSATYTDADLGECTVAVSADGVASLSAAALASAGVGRSLIVTPTAAPALPCRIRGITADIGTTGTTARTRAGSTNIQLTGSGSQWTPDPCDLPDAFDFSTTATAVAA